MKIFDEFQKLFTHRLLNIVGITAIVVAILVSTFQPARADDLTPPAVPANIQVPTGNKLFFVGRATGTQNYICLPADGGVKFTLFTPQATLFKESEEAATHYFSPNPVEGGAVRATWQHSNDSSIVWGKVADGNSSTDPVFVAPGAIPWLLVTITGVQNGPSSGDKLAKTTFIQRLNTGGGMAPSTGCTATTDVGNRAYVPYTADYYFYKGSK
ncbi:MAG: DUF3455 domain-containing protein [Caldilineaceae bacterium]